MRVLITGGFGFIGGRLAQHLSQCGHHVVLGSRTPRARPEWLREASVVQLDWTDPAALAWQCEDVDVIVHSAGMNASDCAADPVAALQVNGRLTAALVDAASKSKVQRLIYLSTAHVYAAPLSGCITESSCPRNPHPYASSHLAGEQAVLEARQRGRIHGIVLRLSNAFGAPAHPEAKCWDLLVNDLCRQVAQSGAILLRSAGTDERDFISLSEVRRIIGLLAERPRRVSDPALLNLGSGISMTVLEMAEAIQARCVHVLGFAPEIVRKGHGSKAEPQRLCYKSFALQSLGISVSTDYSSELDNLLVYCLSQFGAARECVL